ncbi:hypothetical protein ACFLUE_02715 [Chloroflexota bacterium]
MRITGYRPGLFTLRKILTGVLSYIPGVIPLARRTVVRVVEVGTVPEARYRYSIWLEHLVVARAHGLPTQPESVVEFGPGASLGMGLAALISGSRRYFGLDVVRHCNPERDIEVFDRLVELFRKREAIPAQDEFPDVLPRLDSYDFPADILTRERLAAAMTEDRLAVIRKSLADVDSAGDSPVRYIVPWPGAEIINKLKNSVDMVCSQAVLQYVGNLQDIYQMQYLWLRSGGYVSHEIPLGAVGLAVEWNGHWRYSDLTWKLVRGHKPYSINRQPHSAHIRLLKGCGFRIAGDLEYRQDNGILKKQLAPRWRNVVSEDDLTCRAAFIQAVKD